jgi:hypothetical protein
MEEEAARLGSGIDEGAANKQQLVAGALGGAWRARALGAAAWRGLPRGWGRRGVDCWSH